MEADPHRETGESPLRRDGGRQTLTGSPARFLLRLGSSTGVFVGRPRETDGQEEPPQGPVPDLCLRAGFGSYPVTRRSVVTTSKSPVAARSVGSSFCSQICEALGYLSSEKAHHRSLVPILPTRRPGTSNEPTGPIGWQPENYGFFRRESPTYHSYPETYGHFPEYRIRSAPLPVMRRATYQHLSTGRHNVRVTSQSILSRIERSSVLMKGSQ